MSVDYYRTRYGYYDNIWCNGLLYSSFQYLDTSIASLVVDLRSIEMCVVGKLGQIIRWRMVCSSPHSYLVFFYRMPHFLRLSFDLPTLTLSLLSGLFGLLKDQY